MEIGWAGMRASNMLKPLVMAALLSTPLGAANAAYWSVFNIEGESTISAAFVTYNTLTDMLTDTNRTGLFQPTSAGFGQNVVGSGSDGKTYWNLFNIEGESALSAAFVTYNTRMDMLTDTNRTGLFEPTSAGFGQNIVGSASDGKSYWNVFNIEGESAISAAFVTYNTLADMLTDTNRTGLFEPDSAGFGQNVIGSGSDGKSYWNVFNIEGESTISAAIVTYGTLADMLLDTNRTGVFLPGSAGFGQNIVGGDADILMDASVVPVPAAVALFPAGLAALGLIAYRARRRDKTVRT